MRPEVSVIIPIQNEEIYLPVALDSLVYQTLDDFEVIAVDDSSTDSSITIAESYRNRLRVMVVQNEDVPGVAGALNTGLRHASAPLIARHDADDVSDPRRLQIQVSFMAASPEVVCAGTLANSIDDTGTLIGPYRLPRDRLLPINDSDIRQVLPWICPFVHGSMILRRKTIEMLGGYRSAFVFAEDYDLWLRVSEIGRLAIIPDALYSYRTHENSMWGSRKRVGRLFTNLAREMARERFYLEDDILMRDQSKFWERYGPAIRGSLSQDEIDYVEARIGGIKIS